MIQLYSLVLSLLIDGQENRDIATADVVGPYLIMDMHDHVIVKLTGESVDVMCEVNIKYKNKKVLYRNLLKSSYIYTQSLLL